MSKKRLLQMILGAILVLGIFCGIVNAASSGRMSQAADLKNVLSGKVNDADSEALRGSIFNNVGKILEERQSFLKEQERKSEQEIASATHEGQIIIEVEDAAPLAGEPYFDENGIKWRDIYVEIGNISAQERDYFTEFFQKYQGHGFLDSDYDKPQDVDMSLVFYGGQTSEWSVQEMEEPEIDHGYILQSEIDERLMKFMGLTNEQMTDPLVINEVNGENVAAWIASDSMFSTPICLGGYKEGNTYTLLMDEPLSIVTLRKNENDTLAILSNRLYDWYGKEYNPNEKYSVISESHKDHLSYYSKAELELLRDEYYARHGMIFDEPEIKLYFEAMSWYQPSIGKDSFDESVFNTIEKENITFLNEKIKEKEMFAAYDNFTKNKKAESVAFIYFDEDSIPELLLIENSEYHLYTCKNLAIKELPLSDTGLKANVYGPKHDFENAVEETFYWFEYVPYKGLLRIHGEEADARYDYYLRYTDGSFTMELKAGSAEHIWKTYDGEKEIANEEFLKQLSALGYDELTPCAYLYEYVEKAYENIDRISNAEWVLEAFVEGREEAFCSVAQRCDIPKEGFSMRSYDEIYKEITCEEDWWGENEYVDFDNDGQMELILHGYSGARMFFDVIGETVYQLLRTGGTTDFASVSVMEGKYVIERGDFLHANRKYYWIMTYDSCGCLIDYFCLATTYKGDQYTKEDEFFYRNENITMEEFEALRNRIQSIPKE